jgi:hypothetical protein
VRAVVITPGQKASDRLVEVPDPTPASGEALIRVLSVGVDGTDDELVSGQYGQAPQGDDQLIIGHESLGRVVEPAGQLVAGQLVAAIVRRPDPVPCLNCAHDEWDYCLNGQYTERGIKGRHGFLAEYEGRLAGWRRGLDLGEGGVARRIFCWRSKHAAVKELTLARDQHRVDGAPATALRSEDHVDVSAPHPTRLLGLDEVRCEIVPLFFGYSLTEGHVTHDRVLRRCGSASRPPGDRLGTATTDLRTAVVSAHPVVLRMAAARACASCTGPPSPAHRPQPS